jgi:hypothetical protein
MGLQSHKGFGAIANHSSGTIKVIIKGLKKAKLLNVIENSESFIAEILPENKETNLKKKDRELKIFDVLP